jgi:Ca-activated chloride channel family protein
VNVELTCKQPIKSVYSPSHEVEIKRHDNTTAAIGYEANNVTPNTDFQLFFSSERKNDIGLNVLTYNDGADSDGGSFLMMLSPSAEMRDEKIVEKDVVFVLDKSGSMADDHKIEQAQKALLFCLKNLNKGDRFEIVRFSTEAEPLFAPQAGRGIRHRAQDHWRHSD